MIELISLTALSALVIKNAPSWLAALRGTVLEQGREVAIDKSKSFVLAQGGRGIRQLFQLDEKEQLRHLEQALKNATERGLAAFEPLAERDQYRAILSTLLQPDPSGDALRREVLPLFTLAASPNYTALSELYNRRQRFYDATHQDIDATPYLRCFFNALLQELYADPYFRPQLSDALHLRLSTEMQRMSVKQHQTLLDVVAFLQSIDERLAENYSTVDLANDVATYQTYIERTLHYLRIDDFKPKASFPAPELERLFVPLRIALHGQEKHTDMPPDTLVAALEQVSSLVLLGGPGSGKSTATKYLAWSHAVASLHREVAYLFPLLSGSPLPLRIELGRLSRERKRKSYDFLTFATDVMLKNDGIDLRPQMFKELLTRRCLVLLFDGLDEVATRERLQLVKEIEHFALAYPGNRVVVTSLPMGHELARFSHPIFAHATIQPFNREQIKQFIENWYTSVAYHPSSAAQEREERDALLTILAEQPRLYALVENPRLLAIITDLHRDKPLTGRLLQAYGDCANVLVETWDTLCDTAEQWRNMHMGKTDRQHCVVHLGFVLHEQAQKPSDVHEEEERDIVEEDAKALQPIVVTQHFVQRHIEKFLAAQALIAEKAEQRKEAELFIELMRTKAGPLVERGSNAQDEPLYSFIHRAFQEYFAAVAVYERYQQEDEEEVISDFLIRYVHNPHWREVTLLLLDKLPRPLVTRQLQQLLMGKLVTERSRYTSIVQQDLFFVCDCLLEGVMVQNSLVALVVAQLRTVIATSRFPQQRQEALAYLGKLAQTQQYNTPARQELLAYSAQEQLLESMTYLHAIKTLYLSSPLWSEEQQFAYSVLQTWLQHTAVAVEQIRHVALSLYQAEGAEKDEQAFAVILLRELLQRSDLSLEERSKVAGLLYDCSDFGSEEEQLAITSLKELIQRPDLSLEEAIAVAELVYRVRSAESEEGRIATALLSKLMQRPDSTDEQKWLIALALYRSRDDGTEERRVAADRLRELVQRPDVAIEQVRQTVELFYNLGSASLEEQELATFLLREMVQRAVKANVSIEQIRQTAELLYQVSSTDAKAQALATSLLRELAQRPGMSVEQRWRIAESLYLSSHRGTEERQRATLLLQEMMQQPELSVEQIRETAISLQAHQTEGTEETRFARTLLKTLLQRSDLSVKQLAQIAVVLYRSSPTQAQERIEATALLLALLERENALDGDDKVYDVVRAMVPHFHELAKSAERPPAST